PAGAQQAVPTCPSFSATTRPGMRMHEHSHTARRSLSTRSGASTSRHRPAEAPRRALAPRSRCEPEVSKTSEDVTAASPAEVARLDECSDVLETLGAARHLLDGLGAGAMDEHRWVRGGPRWHRCVRSQPGPLLRRAGGARVALAASALAVFVLGSVGCREPQPGCDPEATCAGGTTGGTGSETGTDDVASVDTTNSSLTSVDATGMTGS